MNDIAGDAPSKEAHNENLNTLIQWMNDLRRVGDALRRVAVGTVCMVGNVSRLYTPQTVPKTL
jgi:hypothetical protein